MRKETKGLVWCCIMVLSGILIPVMHNLNGGSMVTTIDSTIPNNLIIPTYIFVFITIISFIGVMNSIRKMMKQEQKH